VSWSAEDKFEKDEAQWSPKTRYGQADNAYSER